MNLWQMFSFSRHSTKIINEASIKLYQNVEMMATETKRKAHLPEFRDVNKTFKTQNLFQDQTSNNFSKTKTSNIFYHYLSIENIGPHFSSTDNVWVNNSNQCLKVVKLVY